MLTALKKWVCCWSWNFLQDGFYGYIMVLKSLLLFCKINNKRNTNNIVWMVCLNNQELLSICYFFHQIDFYFKFNTKTKFVLIPPIHLQFDSLYFLWVLIPSSVSCFILRNLIYNLEPFKLEFWVNQTSQIFKQPLELTKNISISWSSIWKQ